MTVCVGSTLPVGAGVPVGASVGVTRIGVAGGQVAFREADDALRAAKRGGKGCVRVTGRTAGAADTGPDFATRNGPQIMAISRMIARVTGRGSR